MIGWCSWGAMNLAWAVEYAVHTGRTRIVIFEWPIPLTGLRATKSGIDCRIFGVFTMFARLCLLRRGLPLLSLAFDVPGLLAVLLLQANRLSSPAQKRVMNGLPWILASLGRDVGRATRRGCYV